MHRCVRNGLVVKSFVVVLPEVAASVGTVSWATFSQQCGSVGDSIRKAEECMAQLGKGQLTAPDWVCCLFEPRAKLQGSWGHKLKSLNREVYLDLLSQDDKVDFRSFGGPGAGAFLEAPVVREDETPTFVPNAHFIVALRDRLMLPVCPPGSTCHRRNKDGVICGKPLDSTLFSKTSSTISGYSGNHATTASNYHMHYPHD